MFKKIAQILENGQFSPKKSQNYYSKSSDKSDFFDFYQLVKLWPSIVGERLAEHTIPLKNKNRNLTILTDHPAYSQQLSFMEEQLREKIIKQFPQFKGHIKKLYFQTGSNFFQKKDELENALKSKNITQAKEVKAKLTLHPFSPEYKKIEVLAKKEFESIEDEDLKSQMVSLFIQSHLLKSENDN
tara:strand:+ start:46636 stop:47190 length:555 start_codon:yes stop_codon:yes gene_type:complete